MNEPPKLAVVNGSKYLSLTQAAKACGKSKGTVSKALTSGRLSYVSKDDGGYQIDPAELQRWVDATPSRNRSAPDVQPITPTDKNPIETSIERAKLEVMEGRLDAAEKTIDHLRGLLDEERAERKALTERLLPAPQKPVESVGWFDRLLGRGQA